ncbi:MAG TPA: SpoIIE family protein phosphatase [bacterium]|nr:SpoIIE family protein phosphatase [bacterium]
MDKDSLEFLVEASKILNSTLDLDTLLSLVYDLVVSAVNCETCSLGKLDEKSDRIRILIGFGKSRADLANPILARGEGVIGQVVATGGSLVANDATELARYRDPLGEALKIVKRTSLGVPLMRGGHVRGAIEAINKDSGEFTSHDLEVLSSLAEQIAIALDNATFYETSQREANHRRLLYEVGVRISSSLDLGEVLNLILDCLRQAVKYDAGAMFLVDPETVGMMRLATAGYDPADEKLLEIKFGEGLVGWVAKNGESVIVDDVSKDSRYIKSRAATKSEIVAPLFADEKIVGVLNLESDRIGAFTEEDLALIKAFGSQAAISIERAILHAELMEKRRLEDELDLARRIQMTFLPDVLPEIPGFELSALNLPSEEVSGDYYDIIRISPGQWGLVIADVFGKGIPASLVMASFRASLLAEIRNNYAIRTILAKVNRLIWESVEPERCVTACYGVLDTKAGVLTYSNAGHIYPLLISQGGVRSLTKGGMLLGAIREVAYEEERIHLRSGDLLLLFTDGLTEPENERGEPFGENRIADIARSLLDLPCAEIVSRLHEEILKFTHGMLTDDFTMLAVKVK